VKDDTVNGLPLDSTDRTAVDRQIGSQCARLALSSCTASTHRPRGLRSTRLSSFPLKVLQLNENRNPHPYPPTPIKKFLNVLHPPKTPRNRTIHRTRTSFFSVRERRHRNHLIELVLPLFCLYFAKFCCAFWVRTLSTPTP
jgi:hypothetical protein